MKLSIITINYNNKAGLEKTVASVMSQNWRDFEWIIIDGGSTDGSKEVIEKLNANPNANIAFWCSEPDNGVYNAMNKGISHAKGEYLNFMNSGDLFASPDSLSIVFKNTSEEELLFGLMVRENINGRINNLRNMKSELKWYDFYFDSLGHQSTFLKKSVFVKFGVFNESYKILADWEYWIRVILYEGISYKFLPYKISIYEGGGLSDSPAMLDDLKRLRKAYYPEMIMKQSIPLIYETNLIKHYKITRLINHLLFRIARFYKNRFDKEFNEFI